MTKFLLSLLIFAVCFLLAATVSAQTTDDTIRVDTQLIEVPVVVTDRLGKPVLDLKKSNFAVFEDGKPQEIAEFGPTAAPFEVALLLDTSGSTRAELALIRRAATEFIASLRPGDRVAIVSYRTGRTATAAFSEAEVLSSLTDDRRALSAALEKVSTSNSTPFYDSVVKIVESVFAAPAKPEFRGRRAIVALTDGVDSASAFEYSDAKAAIGKAGILGYFIEIDTQDFFEDSLTGDCAIATRLSVSQIRRFYRTYYPSAKVEKTFDFCRLGDFERLEMSKGLYDLADKELRELSKISGGKVFPVTELGEARTAFRQVAEEIGTKYSLGYYSNNVKSPGAFRSITVELRGAPAGSTVRAREGYQVQ